MAWHYKQYLLEQSEADRIAYAQAEEQTRGENRGLWAGADPTPPWDWRHQQKAVSSAATKWAEVCGNESQTVYAAPSTIHMAGNKATMWSLLDLKVADTTASMPYLSMKMLNEYDCKKENTAFSPHRITPKTWAQVKLFIELPRQLNGILFLQARRQKHCGRSPVGSGSKRSKPTSRYPRWTNKNDHRIRITC